MRKLGLQRQEAELALELAVLDRAVDLLAEAEPVIERRENIEQRGLKAAVQAGQRVLDKPGHLPIGVLAFRALDGPTGRDNRVLLERERRLDLLVLAHLVVDLQAADLDQGRLVEIDGDVEGEARIVARHLAAEPRRCKLVAAPVGAQQGIER